MFVTLGADVLDLVLGLVFVTLAGVHVLDLLLV